MLWSLLVGAAVGYLACYIMKVKAKWWVCILLGLAGGLVGGLIGGLLNAGSVGGLLGIIFAVLGACLIVFVYKKIK